MVLDQKEAPRLVPLDIVDVPFEVMNHDAPLGIGSGSNAFDLLVPKAFGERLAEHGTHFFCGRDLWMPRDPVQCPSGKGLLLCGQAQGFKRAGVATFGGVYVALPPFVVAAIRIGMPDGRVLRLAGMAQNGECKKGRE